MLDYKIHLYYYAKKIMPRRLQLVLRRRMVMLKWGKCAGAWPKYELDTRLPSGWSGWPGGKKFAFVLTHDVETAKGIDRCHNLMGLEEHLGFKSAFNFVAGEYHVPLEVREELTRRGFEVGIHGLYHNSSLFHSREEFLKQSVQINRILKEWKAVGFRSPCMYHSLAWMHDLEIEYDASTFDIDPFEPQPDGVHTIFPIHVSSNHGEKAYVELPYTLPQDFTLFVLMRNRNIDIWKEKLDWIVENGGMALMVTHPDYMSFEGEKCSYSEYDSGFYREFLEHVKSKYPGQYWQPLPHEIAMFWAGLAGQSESVKLTQVPRLVTDAPKRFRNVCMVAYTFYEEDGRVRRYAEALAGRGDRVDVVALKHNELPDYDTINGVNVYRIQERIINEKSKYSYLYRILKFLAKSTIFISRKHLISKYDVVHVHSVPDFEVFSAMLPKISGTKIILDIHDLVPEFYAAKFKVQEDCLVFRALKFIEKASIRFSDHVIISNHFWEKRLTSRSTPSCKCSTFLNYPDQLFFDSQSATRKKEKFMIIYPGSLNRHQGLDLAVKAFAIAGEDLPGAEFHIYGAGPEEQSIRSLITELGLERRVFLREPLPLDAISKVMAKASVGIVPKRNDPFGGEAFSTKVFEFMALGVPIILSKTKIDSFYFTDSLVQFFEPENYQDLAKALVFLAKDKKRREFLAANALKYIQSLSWDVKKSDYLRLIDGLTNDTIVSSRA